MLPFLASFVRLLCWTSLGGRSLPKGNSFPSRSSALLSDKISGENIPKNFFFFAVRTGLEPATPGVTGRYSNQLNYRTICSDLCVFLERGCKGTHFFETCKFFFDFFAKNEGKSGGKPITGLPPVVFRIRKTVKLNAFVDAQVI